MKRSATGSSIVAVRGATPPSAGSSTWLPGRTTGSDTGAPEMFVNLVWMCDVSTMLVNLVGSGSAAVAQSDNPPKP